MHRILQPAHWAKPVGYANGVVAQGRQIFIGGQIGWTAEQIFETDALVGQVEQSLQNIVAILAEANAIPQHIASMTWYFIDKRDYLDQLEAIGRVYRRIIGAHYPAMAAVQVVSLMEERARVEIQAIAVIPE